MDEPLFDLLVTLNEAYLPQLRVMLTSLLLNNPRRFRLWLVHREIPAEKLSQFGSWLGRNGCELLPITVPDMLFSNAPVTARYPQEMYYRLLAGQILPETVKKILYLDPDTLIINPVEDLLALDTEGKIFAAAAHTGKTELANAVNRLRLGTAGDYFNSGVMTMDLRLARERIDPDDIFRFAAEHANELLLPDQDILNCLYEHEIVPVDDAVWNYDARKYSNYYLRSSGEQDAAWVMAHTSVLHFCGAAKPWKEHYPYRFGILYRHYMQLAAREA